MYLHKIYTPQPPATMLHNIIIFWGEEPVLYNRWTHFMLVETARKHSNSILFSRLYMMHLDFEYTEINSEDGKKAVGGDLGFRNHW